MLVYQRVLLEILVENTSRIRRCGDVSWKCAGWCSLVNDLPSARVLWEDRSHTSQACHPSSMHQSQTSRCFLKFALEIRGKIGWQVMSDEILVVWNHGILFSITYMGCHPSHWRTPSFFRGVGRKNHQPDDIMVFLVIHGVFHGHYWSS